MTSRNYLLKSLKGNIRRNFWLMILFFLAFLAAMPVSTLTALDGARHIYGISQVYLRNTFINSPETMKPTMEFGGRENLLFAGQMTGVEGYVESASSGLVAGINAARLCQGLEPVVFPAETAHGSLCHYITTAPARHFQPMNVNFGIMSPIKEKIRDKKLKKQRIAERALVMLEEFKNKYEL